MYKNRLKKWGHRRNINKRDVQAMAWEYLRRQRVGKDTIFKIHGKDYSVQMVKRSRNWQPYTRSIEEVGLGDMPSMPKDLTCLTPPPISLQAPEELEYSHRLFRSVRDYYLGAYKNGVWAVSDRGDCYSTLDPSNVLFNKFVDITNNVGYLAWVGDFNGARRMIKLATSLLESVVVRQSPRLINVLMDFYAASRSDLAKDENTWKSVLNLNSHGAQLVRRTLGTCHPSCSIFDYLSKDGLESDEVFTRLWECVVKSFVENLDPIGSQAVSQMSDYNKRVLVQSDGWAAVAAQMKLVDDCVQVHGTGHRITLYARTSLAECYWFLDRDQEAEEELLHAVVEFKLSDTDSYGRKYYCLAIIDLAFYEYANGKTNLAEQHFREAWQNCSALFGPTDSYTLCALANLKQYLDRNGKSDAADEMETLITGVVDEMEKLHLSLERDDPGEGVKVDASVC